MGARVLIRGLLIDDVTVTRASRASDGEGGWTLSYAQVATPRARVRPAKATERVMAAQENVRLTHVVYVESGTDVQRGDRITWKGRTLTVVAVREPSPQGHHLELDCEETQRGA